MITRNHRGHFGKYYQYSRWIIEGGKYKGTVLLDASNDHLFINGHSWTINKAGYVVCTKHRELLHRSVMGAKVNQTIDHKNHDTLDNRLINLRFVTHTENMNNRKPNKSSMVPIKGVWWDKNAWVSELTVKKKKKRLGRYDEFYDAACSRIRAEIEIAGETSLKYTSLIKHIPSKYKLSWFPEIFDSNYKIDIDDDFVKSFFAYSKEDRNGLRMKIQRYRNQLYNS